MFHSNLTKSNLFKKGTLPPFYQVKIKEAKLVITFLKSTHIITTATTRDKAIRQTCHNFSEKAQDFKNQGQMEMHLAGVLHTV